MRPRGILKDIAYGFCNTFNSRNNDVDGYWGIGVLYLHAIEHNTQVVCIDLLRRTISPKSNRLQILANTYANYISNRANQYGLPNDWITAATVMLRFNCTEGAQPYRSACGDPYVIEMSFQAKTGFQHTNQKTGYCRPHNPKRERRRWND